MSTGKVIENPEFRNREHVFADREDAARMLVAYLQPLVVPGSIVLAVPSGGVPIGRILADSLGLEVDLCIVRKAQVPWNPEAGFGAVNRDGDVNLNDSLVREIGLTAAAIERQVARTRAVLEQREQLFRRGRPFPSVEGKTVFLVDDGLASGYTMVAAIRFLRKRKPGRVIVAVPTGPRPTVEKLAREADALVCLNVRDFFPFAVAAAYRDWYDLADADVLAILHAPEMRGGT